MSTSRRIVLLLALAVAGCASVPTTKFIPLGPPKSNESLVYLYRMTGHVGTWVPARVMLNGREATRLPNMTSFGVYLSSGPLVVTAFVGDSVVSTNDNAKIELRRDLLPGKTYYFKIDGVEYAEATRLQITTHILTVIREVSAERANEEMAALDMVAVR